MDLHRPPVCALQHSCQKLSLLGVCTYHKVCLFTDTIDKRPRKYTSYIFQCGDQRRVIHYYLKLVCYLELVSLANGPEPYQHAAHTHTHSLSFSRLFSLHLWTIHNYSDNSVGQTKPLPSLKARRPLIHSSTTTSSGVNPMLFLISGLDNSVGKTKPLPS